MTATPQGTARYFEKIQAKGVHALSAPLGRTELLVSRVGFGGYRLHEFEPEHREALTNALLGGCNLIDTSSNYTDGSSERLIGQVLSELIGNGSLKRDEVVVVSKVGYVQGTALKEAKGRAERGTPYRDMVEYQSDCWHNISPEFLEAQITECLQRLRLEQLDVLLLHNPEYYLKSSGTRDVYYQRIEKAFRYLESECVKGRIQFYGISSNTFPEDEARSDFTSLGRIIEIAAQVARPSKFAVIEFPFNLLESGAALTKNNKQETVFDVAARANLGVLTNRPFNSYGRGKLIRLTSFPTHDEVTIKGGMHTTLGRAIELEKLAPGFPKAAQAFQWAHVLRDKMGDFDDLLAWREALYQQIYPSIRNGIERLTTDRQPWAEEYRNVMRELLGLITSDLENLAAQKSSLFEEQIMNVAPELRESTLEPQSLSRRLLRLYTGFPQVSSVLVGMRHPSYVRDVLVFEPPMKANRAAETMTRFLRHRS